MFYNTNLCINFTHTFPHLELPSYVGEVNTYLPDFDLDGSFDEDCANKTPSKLYQYIVIHFVFEKRT